MIRKGQHISPEDRKTLSPLARKLSYEFKKLKLGTDNILRRQTGINLQIILPTKLRQLVYKHLHEDMGHLGVDRVLALTCERFYWPHMQHDIEEYITTRCTCIKQKRPKHAAKEPLQPILSITPFELLSIDYMHLDKSARGYEYILVVVDHFTRFAAAYPTKNKSAKTATSCLYNDFILKYGYPECIHHDCGAEFENRLFRNLEQISGIKHSRTTPYHPEGNGKAEHFNRTILSMLRTLPETSLTGKTI